MRVYIVGRSSVKMCRVKGADQDKHFFAHRGQLYKVYPEGLTRLNRYRYGENAGTDELIIYSENSTIPWNTHGIDYSADKVLSEIDEHKLMNYGNGLSFKKSFGSLLHDKSLGNNVLLVVVAVIVALAVIPSLVGGIL